MSIKISELTSGTALTGTEEIPMVQGATTVKTTTQEIADLSNPDVSGLQEKPIVVSANTTATNDYNYTVVANSTFTDPTPVQGKGFKVFVRNGTAVIGGTSYGANSLVFRIFHSGAWANTLINVDLSGYVPNTRTINGYDLSANRTLNASDVGAVASNTPITPGTYHEVTVDEKGLVTAGVTKWGLLSGNPNSATGVISGSARYYTFGDGVPQNGYTFRQIVFVQPTIVKFFAIVTITSQPVSGNCVFTIQKNGVDTAIVITVPSGSASGTFSETATQVSFSQFDTISVKAVNNASATSCVVSSLSIGIL